MPAQDKPKIIRGRIRRIAAEPQRAKRGDYLFRGLELSSGPDGQRVFLIIPESISELSRDDLYEFPLLCWEGAEIAASGLEFNNSLDDGALILTVTPESMLVLEPYRSVSVTEAVQAAKCIRLADLNFRMGHDEPFWMAKGRMIHVLFDHLLRNVSDGLKSAFAEVFHTARAALMEALPGSGVSISSRELKDDARSHFEHLQNWFEQHRTRISAAQVEIDRISTRWGMKGRADALLDFAGMETILELKTGRVPVADHGLQLFAYSLLFEDKQGHGPDGFLLYSADGRTENLEKRPPWAIVRARNLVVWLKQSYTLNGSPAHDLLSFDRCPIRGRCFSRAQCVALFGEDRTENEPRLTGPLKEYYDHWFRLLSQDLWEAEGGFARVLNPETLAARVTEGVTVPVVELMASDSTTGRGPMKRELSGRVGNRAKSSHGKSWQAAAEIDRFLLDLIVESSAAEPSPGDEVILHQGDACSPEALRGRVTDTEDRRVRVLVKARPKAVLEQAGSDSFLVPGPSGGWFLDRIPFSRGREIGRQALHRFLTTADDSVIEAVALAPGPLMDNSTRDALSCESALIVGTCETKKSVTKVVEPTPLANPVDESLRYELNQDQSVAVRDSLEAQPYHLIHGPPGTGKTKVLARLIRMCLDRGERVLAACPTNIALDRVLTSVIELGVKDILRVGGRASVSSDFMEAVEKLGNHPALLEDLASQETDIAKFRKRLAETQLVGATAYQCAAHPMFLRQRFDRVIVDEAGQLDEPATLGAIGLARIFVLCGDHLQLPPAVQCVSPDCEADYRLERSLFERLFQSCDESKISRLRVQYRMNREIQEIPSRMFYDGALVASQEAASRRLTLALKTLEDSEINRIIDPDRPVVFVDVQGRNGGKVRHEEADLAARIVSRLVSGGVPASEIGVITPYRVQQNLIRRRLSDFTSKASLVSVDTVDRFQGGEREVIILSLARADGVTSFLADRKRLNVSLSRARSKLILLGHGHVLEEHPLFSSLLEGLFRVTVSPAK